MGSGLAVDGGLTGGQGASSRMTVESPNQTGSRSRRSSYSTTATSTSATRTHSRLLWELQLEFITQAVDCWKLTAELPADSRPKWTVR